MSAFLFKSVNVETVVPAQAGTQVRSASGGGSLLAKTDAGGCPAAGNFLLLRQKKVTKEKATRVRRPSGSLRCSCANAAAELASLRQSSPTSPSRIALLGDSHGKCHSLTRGGIYGR
jgi:hypothetical protein